MAVWNLEIEESDRPKLFCDLFLKIHFFGEKVYFLSKWRVHKKSLS